MKSKLKQLTALVCAAAMMAALCLALLAGTVTTAACASISSSTVRAERKHDE